MLLSIHTQLANFTQNPELEWTQPEAHNMAIAIAAVQDNYPATRVDPGVMALITCGATFAYTEGVKVSAIIARKKREKWAAREPSPQAPMPQQSTAHNPAPAAPSNFDPIKNWEPFGAEAPSPRGVIDFPIIRAV